MKRQELFNELKQLELQHDIDALMFELWAIEENDPTAKKEHKRQSKAYKGRALGVFEAIEVMFDGEMLEHSLNKDNRLLLKRWCELDDQITNLKREVA